MSDKSNENDLCVCGHAFAEHVRVINIPELVCAHDGEDREGCCECMEFRKTRQPGDQEAA